MGMGGYWKKIRCFWSYKYHLRALLDTSKIVKLQVNNSSSLWLESEEVGKILISFLEEFPPKLKEKDKSMNITSNN